MSVLESAKGGVQVQLTPRQHHLGKTGHGGAGLDLKAAEQGITVPAAQHADDILVQTSAHEGSGAARAQQAHADQGGFRPRGPPISVVACFRWVEMSLPVTLHQPATVGQACNGVSGVVS